MTLSSENVAAELAVLKTAQTEIMKAIQARGGAWSATVEFDAWRTLEDAIEYLTDKRYLYKPLR